jgi:gluconate 5-dehydrogenase/2-deoxy-D-gluconate 3-dehydrogenase
MDAIEQFRLAQRVAVVTGGSKGLGRAMAIGLAEAGARVAVASRTRSLIEETASEIVGKGGEAIAVPADMTREEDVEAMTAAVLAAYGRIDILINNAGIGGSKRSADLTVEDWERLMNTNARSVFLACRAVGKAMIRQRSGKIINVGSILGHGALPNSLHYGASKAAVHHMTKTLALEWARFNIQVNCIVPGWFLTEMTKDQQEGENETFLLGKIPFRRFGRPDEIVGLAVYLASGASDYMTGQTLFLDGGYSISS